MSKWSATRTTSPLELRRSCYKILLLAFHHSGMSKRNQIMIGRTEEENYPSRIIERYFYPQHRHMIRSRVLPQDRNTAHIRAQETQTFIPQTYIIAITKMRYHTGLTQAVYLRMKQSNTT